VEEQTEEEMTIEEQIRLLDRGVTALFNVLPTIASSYAALIAEVREQQQILVMLLERQKSPAGQTTGEQFIRNKGAVATHRPSTNHKEQFNDRKKVNDSRRSQVFRCEPPTTLLLN
jgi:hypothetical protein